jgi:hypothetical protein
MHTMAGLRRDRECRLGLVALCLALGLSQGCARSEPLQPTGSNSTASGQRPPFRPAADRAPSGDSAHPAVPPDPQLDSALPFRADSQPRTLPSGTLLTVQLESSLSTGKVHAGDPFAASVAAPLTIDGETLIKPGTAVTGSVEAMQSLALRPGVAPASGYFRLSLSALTVDGRQIALQTSSLFARGTAQKFDAAFRSGFRVPKGRRLIFRLTAPVTLGDSNSIANRQHLSPTTE